MDFILLAEGGSALPKSIRSSVSYSGTIKNGTIRLMTSSSGYSGQKASICFDGKEKSKNMSGINIVVYSNERRCVVDSVNFDTSNPEVPCTR